MTEGTAIATWADLAAYLESNPRPPARGKAAFGKAVMAIVQRLILTLPDLRPDLCVTAAVLLDRNGIRVPLAPDLAGMLAQLREAAAESRSTPRRWCGW